MAVAPLCPYPLKGVLASPCPPLWHTYARLTSNDFAPSRAGVSGTSPALVGAGIRTPLPLPFSYVHSLRFPSIHPFGVPSSSVWSSWLLPPASLTHAYRRGGAPFGMAFSASCPPTERGAPSRTGLQALPFGGRAVLTFFFGYRFELRSPRHGVSPRCCGPRFAPMSWVSNALARRPFLSATALIL